MGMSSAGLTEKCPYCGAACEAEWVDIVVDLVQAGPFHCTQCLASQIGQCGDNYTRTDREKETGWYEPPFIAERVGKKSKRSKSKRSLTIEKDFRPGFFSDYHPSSV